MINFKITFQADELLYGDYEKMRLLCYTLGVILLDFPFLSVVGHPRNIHIVILKDALLHLRFQGQDNNQSLECLATQIKDHL